MPNLAKTMPMSLPSHPSDPELDQSSPTQAVNTNTFTRRSLQKTPTMRYGSGGLSARNPATSASRSSDAAPQRVYKARNVSPVRTVVSSNRMQASSNGGGGRESPLMQQYARRALSPAVSSHASSRSLSSGAPQRTTNGGPRPASKAFGSIPTPRASALPRGGAHSKLPSPKK